MRFKIKDENIYENLGYLCIYAAAAVAFGFLCILGVDGLMTVVDSLNQG